MLLAAVCKAADLPAPTPAGSTWPGSGCDNLPAGQSCDGSCPAGYSGSVSVTCNSNAGGAPTWGTPTNTCQQCKQYKQLHWGFQGPTGLLHIDGVPMFTPTCCLVTSLMSNTWFVMHPAAGSSTCCIEQCIILPGALAGSLQGRQYVPDCRALSRLCGWAQH